MARRTLLYKASPNIFTLPIARQILLICEWIAAEHDTPYSGDEILFEILHFSWFGIAPLEIAKLSVLVSQTQFEANQNHFVYCCTKNRLRRRRIYSVHLSEPLKSIGDVGEIGSRRAQYDPSTIV